jgi:hypothetical protein
LKDRGEKKIVIIPFFGAINFTKLNNFIFGMLKKKIWANFQRMIELFTQKNVTKLSKIGGWDPGSEILKKPFPDPGSRGQKGTGSRTRIRNTDIYISSSVPEEAAQPAHPVRVETRPGPLLLVEVQDCGHNPQDLCQQTIKPGLQPNVTTRDMSIEEGGAASKSPH